jgi:Protein of unknown function (DUF3443)
MLREDFVRKKLLCVLTLLGSLGFAVGCGSSGSTPSGIPGGGGTTANVLSIAVDGGPTTNQANGPYPNGAFATVTICAPGSSSNCATVDHLLVDTGSVGVRVLQSAVSALNLPMVNANNGSAAWECVSFVDGSLLWGPVQKATVTMAGETASSVPIQVVATSSSNIPSSCSGVDENTVALLGANGILGVGLEPVDCPACDPSETSTPIVPAYYSCSSTPCTPELMNDANQVTNPVASLAVDNNGVLVELPSVSGSAATVTGSLIFGIGTESNNALASTANFFNLCDDLFNTIFEGQTFGVNPSSCTGEGSFIDSGSNALFFPNVNSAITVCSGDFSAFYCPASLLNLSAVNQDPTNGTDSPVVDFSVDNAQNLFTGSTASNAAFSTLAGPVPAASGFDWGLPFFYGKNVYTGIDQAGLGIGQQTPFWAYY